MPPLYKQRSKNQQHPDLHCKDCGSQSIKRVHRTFFEKFLSALTSGRYAYQKYYCKACKTATFKGIMEAEKATTQVVIERGSAF